MLYYIKNYILYYNAIKFSAWYVIACKHGEKN